MGIYKIKGSPYFQYDFTVNGERHRGSTETDSRKQAQAIHAKLRSKAVEGAHYEQKESLTLEQVMAKYELSHAQFGKSYDNSVRFHVDNLLAGLGRSKPFEKIGQEELANYVLKCRTEKYRRGKDKNLRIASPSTINRRISTFRKAYKLAKHTWNIHVQEIDFGRLMLDEPEAPNNPLTKKEAMQVMNAAKPHHKRFIIVSLYTGWREANVLAIHGKRDLDIENMEVKAKGKSALPGGKEVTAVINTAFLDYILRKELHKIDGAIITWRGKQIKRIGGNAWKALFKAAGVKYRRIHDLRHTFGTWLYEATQDLGLVQEALNHADIATSRRYAHSNKEMRRKQLDSALLPKLRQNAVRRVKG